MPKCILKFDGENKEQLTPAIKGYIQDIDVTLNGWFAFQICDVPKGLGRVILDTEMDVIEPGLSGLFHPRTEVQNTAGEYVNAYERFYIDGRPLVVRMAPKGDKPKKGALWGTIKIVWSDLHS